MEGIERIKVLASEVKDEAVLEIVKYLISRTDMNDKYLNEEKCLKQTPTENREKADDRLDIEYKYILDILKKEK